MSLLSTAASGLRAAQAALNTYSNNVANAQTAGYNRRDEQFQNRVLGGVNSLTVSSFDPITATRVSQLEGLSSETQAKSTALSNLDQSLSGTATSLTSTITAFQKALGDAADNPSDASLRDIVVARASAMASEATAGMGELDNQLSDLAQQQTAARDAATAKVNELVSLNKDAMSNPNNMDIRDKQAQVGKELSDLIGGEVRFGDNGQAMFLVGGSLVINGPIGKMPVPSQAGGKLGGLQAAAASVQSFRATYASTLSAFSTSINSINAQGVDGSGNAGGDLFAFNGTALKFTGTANGLAIDSAGGVNGDNARQMLGIDSLGSDVAAMASKAAAQTQTAQTEFSSRAASLQSALDAQTKTQGVDLDAQTVLMKNAQDLYSANAKVLQTQASLFGTLLNTIA